MEDEFEIVAIRHLDPLDDSYTYLSNWYKRVDGSYDFNTGYDVDDAADLSSLSESDQLEIFLSFQEDWEDYDCELVRIKRTTQVTDLLGNSDEYKEALQKRALSKLTEKDVKILGLTNLAVYIKTKYHNA